MNKGDIEKFIIDFLYIKECNETIKNSEVQFSAKNQYIEINGNKVFFDPYYIKDDGLSNDNLYNKIVTPQFEFWVQTKDYQRFLNVLKFRQDLQIKNRQLKVERDNLDRQNTFEYDEIDDDIYKCFIAHKSGMCDRIGTWEHLFNVEKEIENRCTKNNGKYYKSESKNAKFVIIFNPSCKAYTVVSKFKNKGYKVTSFEKVVEYFKLTHLFNIDRLIQFQNELSKSKEVNGLNSPYDLFNNQ